MTYGEAEKRTDEMWKDQGNNASEGKERCKLLTFDGDNLKKFVKENVPRECRMMRLVPKNLIKM
ncbi:hypothetical protein JW890_04980 [candidate division WOR-3 bacterium]|nr:hypothetical protein [candidate division WOR-3 bacterium]